MTKPIHPPASWRDLSHAELIALLEEAIVFQSRLRPRDLVWAKWIVASAATGSTLDGLRRAWDVEEAAFNACRSNHNSKTLATYETAKNKAKRAKGSYERAVRQEEALYALHQQMIEAERG